MTLDEALKKSRAATAFSKSSIKAANNVIQSGENVRYASVVNAALSALNSAGKPDPAMLKRKASGVFALTDKRLVFCSSAFVGSVEKIIPLEDILSLDFAAGPMGLTQVRFNCEKEVFTIDCAKSDAEEITRIVGKKA